MYSRSGATPTTHLFKLSLGRVGNMQADLSTSVENEWLCAQIVREFGIPAADCEIADFEDQHVLVVKRFDRRTVGGMLPADFPARVADPIFEGLVKAAKRVAELQ